MTSLKKGAEGKKLLDEIITVLRCADADLEGFIGHDEVEPAAQTRREIAALLDRLAVR